MKEVKIKKIFVSSIVDISGSPYIPKRVDHSIPEENVDGYGLATLADPNTNTSIERKAKTGFRRMY
ncbi:MAG: hypothetical protein V1818_03830 [Candidatus Aenigmatarchaeota archaeon]